MIFTGSCFNFPSLLQRGALYKMYIRTTIKTVCFASTCPRTLSMQLLSADRRPVLFTHLSHLSLITQTVKILSVTTFTYSFRSVYLWKFCISNKEIHSEFHVICVTSSGSSRSICSSFLASVIRLSSFCSLIPTIPSHFVLLSRCTIQYSSLFSSSL